MWCSFLPLQSTLGRFSATCYIHLFIYSLTAIIYGQIHHIPRRTLTAPGILKAKGFKSWLLLMVLPLQPTWELTKNTGVKRSMTQQQSVATTQSKKRGKLKDEDLIPELLMWGATPKTVLCSRITGLWLGSYQSGQHRHHGHLMGF